MTTAATEPGSGNPDVAKGLRRFVRVARADARSGAAKVAGRTIYILPTAPGLVYGLLLLMMLTGSINYANNLGFLLTFLLAALGLVAIIHTWRNLLGLQLMAGRTEPVFAGQPACFEVIVHNPRQAPRPGLRIALKGGQDSLTDLPGGCSAKPRLCLPTSHRGEYSLPRLTLSTTYPLGLLRAWVYIELDRVCLVYPAPGPRMPVAETADYTHSRKGDKGVGADDFAGLRRYRAGDSPRHVNWKALAREQGLQTKLFGGDRAERRWLEWTAVTGATETRLSRLCRGVLDACDRQLEFGLRLPGVEIPPSRGQAHRHECLAALAHYRRSS